MLRLVLWLVGLGAVVVLILGHGVGSGLLGEEFGVGGLNFRVVIVVCHVYLLIIINIDIDYSFNTIDTPNLIHNHNHNYNHN